MWMEDIATTLRRQLGSRASKVPTRRLPDLAFRLSSLFVPVLRTFVSRPWAQNDLTAAKARRMLGFRRVQRRRPLSTAPKACSGRMRSSRRALWPGRVSGNGDAQADIRAHHAAGADDSAIANGDAGQDDGAAADRTSLPIRHRAAELQAGSSCLPHRADGRRRETPSPARSPGAVADRQLRRRRGRHN